ncbi:FAD:protein FMN transferase [Fulvimonas yonginensis]|uniref:FAD:protein FMN transferase n=1 Tax=Fulvimonas yonginensis TaxID=1495200 RepID=A0ABU8JET2_9GAMM
MIRRARPLLGTFVEIRARADQAVLTHAFEAVAQAHALMSYQDTASELSRLNSEAWRRPVPVHPWTWRVLAAARWLHVHSAGAFDCTVPDGPDAGMDAVELLPGRTVRFRRRVRLDLSGIAKGFAVDRAIDRLRRAGSQGLVNAGGDLRVFGPSAEPILVRDPDQPQRLRPLGTLADGALATSAPYFSEQDGRWAVRDPRDGGSPSRYRSVSVLAPTCLRADALTKVVWVRGAEAAGPLLARLRAEAIVL